MEKMTQRLEVLFDALQTLEIAVGLFHEYDEKTVRESLRQAQAERKES